MNVSSGFEREIAENLIGNVMCIEYNNRGAFCATNAKDAAINSAPVRTILTIAKKEQRSMYQYIDSPRKRQYPNVRIFTMFGGAS